LSDKHWDYTGRVERKKDGNFYVNEKLHAHKDHVHFWLAAKFNLNELILRRYNALVAYKQKDYDIFAQHESRDPKESTKLELGKLHLGAFYRHGKYQAGLKGSFLHWEEDNLKKF